MPLQARPKITFPGIIAGQKVKRLSHDFETFSKVNVTDVSSDAYSRHKSTEVLMCSFARDDEPIDQWVPMEGEPMPAKLEDAVLDERIVKTCWNKDFEWSIWSNTLGMVTPHEAWRDTQIMAFALTLPASLEKAGIVVGIDEDKKKTAEGRALIRTFSMPRKPTKNKLHLRNLPHHEPEKWEAYKAYNRQDTEAERAILKKLLVFDLPREEWELWIIDQIINQNGIPMNMDAVEAAIRLYEHVLADRLKKMADITGLANPNSNAQLLPWLRDQGYPFFDLKKGHIKRARDAVREELKRYDEEGIVHHGVQNLTADERARLTGPDVRMPVTKELLTVLKLRSEASRTSSKKYFAIRRCVDKVAWVLRNTLQFAGAGRTWRWAGRVFQPQNLPRPDKEYEKIIEMVVRHLEILDPEAIELVYDNPMDLLATCIRSVAQAPEGYLFVDADLNAIENRVLGWISLCRKILRVFELKRDPYIDFATYMYHQPYDELLAEYKAGDGAKRTISKPAVLGCGYRLGPGAEYVNEKSGEVEATGLLGYARNMFVIMTPAQAAKSVEVFRATFVEVVEFWDDIEKAAKKCVRTGEPTQHHMIRFDIKAPYLRMILPSGRALHYCRPRIEPVKTPWGQMKPQITYEQLNDKNQWERTSTHGGKLTENADQAIARDLLAYGMKLAYYRGLDIRLHVHDQIIGLSPEDEAEEHLRVLIECMEEPPPWSVYRNWTLPLVSNGHISKVFKKD